MIRWALDTDALSEALKVRPNKHLVSFLADEAQRCGIPAPAWHELWFGFHRLPRGRRRDAVADWLANIQRSMPVVPYDADAATWHASERARLVSLGRTPPTTDGAIAAIACTRGLTLVTANIVDFRRFEGLEVLDWRKARPRAS